MDDGLLLRVAERAKAYRDSYKLKDKNPEDTHRERILLFLALDELEGRNGACKRAEPRRGVEEGSGAGPADDRPPS